jgi:hypothetical protein
MATEAQSSYIADLAVLKTKEFKEVKELLLANQIVGVDAETVGKATSIAEITGALTDLQASKLIDALIATKEPTRGRVYSSRRVETTIGILDDVKATISDWNFS